MTTDHGAAPQPVAHQHAAAVQQGAYCWSCPLHDGGQGPVMPEPRQGSPLVVVGEAPGKNEVEEGRPFVGASGEVVDAALLAGGVPRAHAWVTNTMLCRAPGGDYAAFVADAKAKHAAAAREAKARRMPPPLLVLPHEACAPRLGRELEQARQPGPYGQGVKVVLAVGGEALRGAAAHYKLPFDKQKSEPGTPRVATIKRQHGSPVDTGQGVTLCSSLHPAMAMHGDATYLPVIREDISRAARVARHLTATGESRLRWDEPDYLLNPGADEAVNFIEMLRLSKARVTVDIETDSVRVHTAKIRCIGIGARVDGRPRVGVIPWVRMQGGSWWGPADEMRIFAAMLRLLSEAPLAGHNLLFDTAVLLRHGFLRAREKLWFDTMVAHHDTDHSELPHDLGFVFGRFFVAPRWKDDADAKVVTNVSDFWLHKYCAKDVYGELLLAEELPKRIAACQTVEAFGTDAQLMPIARDMGELGLVIDEKERQRQFGLLEGVALKRAAEVRQIVGRADFNPNAFRQVARFLYGEKKLTPPYGSGDIEWQQLAAEADEEDLDIDFDDPEVMVAKGSTNELSLLTLLDLGVDTQTRTFIETLLHYRGVSKVMGTYLGLKRGESGLLDDVYRERKLIVTEPFNNSPLSVLHPVWKIHVTPTGRFATSPNAQNWPERVVYDLDAYRASVAADEKYPRGILNTRRMVRAPDGHVIVGADYSQIELRIYAVRAKDRELLRAYAEGLEPHAWNFASMMADSPAAVMKAYERVRKESKARLKYFRNIAKRFVYLLMYGGQKDKLFKTMNADRNPDGTRSFPDLREDQVQRWFDNWHSLHPETHRWQEGVVRRALSTGYVATLLDGRKRFFIGGVDQTAMPNMEIQGTAASIANRALIRINKECGHRAWSPRSGPMAQVHDWIGLVVPKARAREAEDILNRHMPYTITNGDVSLDCTIEQKTAETWDET